MLLTLLNRPFFKMICKNGEEFLAKSTTVTEFTLKYLFSKINRGTY